MEVTSRQRPLVLLFAVILAQVLLLAFQIKRERDVRLVRVWSVELLTPLENAGTYVMTKFSSIWTGYIGLRHTEVENEKLRSQVDALKLRNQQLEGQAAEAARLSRVLGFRQENPGVQMVAAEVIGASADSSSHTIFINRGEHDGLKRNMAVITPDGVVGRISEVSPHVAQVLLVTDKESGVGALLEDTRAHGVVNGAGEPLLHMDYVRGEEKVTVGEKIVTSGEDRIFPKDLPLGTVASTKAGFPMQTVQVEPAARLDRLEEVLVLTTQQPLPSMQAAATSAAASEASGQPTQPSASSTAKAEAPAAPKPAQPKPAVAKASVPQPKPTVKSAAQEKKPGGAEKSEATPSVGQPPVSENPPATQTATPLEQNPPATQSATPVEQIPPPTQPATPVQQNATTPNSPAANPAAPNASSANPSAAPSTDAKPDASKAAAPGAKSAAPAKKPDDKKKPGTGKPPGPGN